MYLENFWISEKSLRIFNENCNLFFLSKPLLQNIYDYIYVETSESTYTRFIMVEDTSIIIVYALIIVILSHCPHIRESKHYTIGNV